MPATYDITKIENFEHDTDTGFGNSLVQIDDTHFIFAYSGSGSDGFIRTISVDENGENMATIDTLEHEISFADSNSFVKIDDTHFALAYTQNAGVAYIKTFSIDGNYDNITQIDSFQFETANAGANSLVLIDSTHLIVAYAGANNYGHLMTFSFDGSYDNIAKIDDFIFNTGGQSWTNSLAKIDTTHFILSFKGDGGDAYIGTYSIDGSYNNIAEIDTLEHDTTNLHTSSLIKIDDTHFFLACAAKDNDGYVKTFSIDGSYDNIALIDSLEHDTDNGTTPSVVMIDSTHFFLCYTTTDNIGRAKTFSIDGSYDNITQTDNIEIVSLQNSVGHSVIMLDNSKAVDGYSGADNDGFLQTFSIDVPPEAADTGFLNMF